MSNCSQSKLGAVARAWLEFRALSFTNKNHIKAEWRTYTPLNGIIIGSGNDSPPIQRQAIPRTSDDFVLSNTKQMYLKITY